MYPLARTEALVVKRLAGETVISDTKSDKVHCLNPSSAWVWEHCDGQTSVADLAKGLHQALGVPDSEELVQLALTQLQRRGLLLNAVAAPSRGTTRRDVLKALAVGVAALPLVMTMAAPTARAGLISFFTQCAYYQSSTDTLYAINQGVPCTTTDGFAGVCAGPGCVAVPVVVIV